MCMDRELIKLVQKFNEEKLQVPLELDCKDGMSSLS